MLRSWPYGHGRVRPGTGGRRCPRAVSGTFYLRQAPQDGVDPAMYAFSVVCAALAGSTLTGALATFRSVHARKIVDEPPPVAPAVASHSSVPPPRPEGSWVISSGRRDGPVPSSGGGPPAPW